MKTLTSFVALLVLLVPSVVSAASFEGKVAMTVTSDRGPTPLTFSLKSGLSRIDVQGPEGRAAAIIMNPAKQEMTILMPQQKMYMVRPIPKPGEMLERNGAASEAAIEKTGEHEKILGYDATKYVSKTPEGTTEVWITDQLGTFMGLGNGPGGGFGGRPGRNGGAHQTWEQAFVGKDAFPLRVVSTTAAGKQRFHLEVTSIDKTAVSDTLFTPPSDYQLLDMGNMMRGMGMPGRMPHPSGD